MTTLAMYATRNDLPVEIRESSIELLNQHLADAMDLYSQTKQAHWNLKGMHFQQLHEFFDKLAGEVEEYVDLIAERVTALGGIANGTVRMASAASRLPEYPYTAVNGRQHVEALVARFASLAKSVRGAIDKTSGFGDATTADLFTEVSRGLDKQLWFLESHLVDE